MNWGILGCANIAEQQFIPALLACPNSTLQAIASREQKKAESWARRWGAARAYGSYEGLLADPAVQAVYIPLPNHLHEEWTSKALRAKKHVLCEKPMAVSSGECVTILELAEREKRFYMEGFMYRFHPQIEQALSWIEEGRLGELRLVRGGFSFLLQDKNNIRLQKVPGAGSLWDVGCYPLHFMNLVFGGPPQSVMAQGDFAAVDLSMVGVLEYGSKKRGLFDCSFDQEGRSHLEIVGTKGSILIPQPWRPDRQEVSLTLCSQGEREEVRFPVSNPYQLEIEHFQACVWEQAEPLLPGHLGLEVVSTIEACYQAARTGRKVPVERVWDQKK